MDDFWSKVIGVVAATVLIYILQAIGFPKFFTTIAGGISGNAIEEAIKEQSKPNNTGTNTYHYTVYNNGTVLDTKTNLLWKRCLEGQEWIGQNCLGRAKAIEWNQAMQHGSNFAGYNDWRVPTIEELRSLVYCRRGSTENSESQGCSGSHQKPTLYQHVFLEDAASEVWSSTEELGKAWTVHFGDGENNRDEKYISFYVRLVRK